MKDMELHEALSQISEIRRQMARTAVFRGYRSATAAFSGVVAVLASVVQSWVVPDPSNHVSAYLAIWLVAAILGVAAAAAEMVVRCVKSRSALQKELTLQAAEQFIPSLVAGALLTIAMVMRMHDEARLLPGLWAILFSLGVFSSRRVLPGAISLVGFYYLFVGLAAVAMTDRVPDYSPWVMGLIFAPGQFLAAIVLWWTLEKDHGRP